jgi:NADH-quinone oxidoreductase subunit N
MYLAIEFNSLSFYVLAAFQRHNQNEYSTEAGLKYFILGALSSGLLLFGESIVYGFTGITNFEELTKLFIGGDYSTYHNNDATALFGNVLSHDAAVCIGVFFILIAFLFKIGAVPFHM